MGDRTDEKFDGLMRQAVRSPSLLTPSTRLCGGRYVVRRLLGNGGMGVVYEATDRHRDANIVIKTLTDVSGAAIYQLKREFRALADLTHPNLVGLYELTCDEDLWFITMDHVPGVTLREYLRSHEDWAARHRVIAELAVGIGAIHAARLLHRDLKPSNVMVTPTGRVVILDFGLACQRQHRAGGGTSPASISGTPHYMSPEQAAGGTIARASDWYAFGVMLYEAISDHVPFRGDKRAVMVAKQLQCAPAPAETLSGVDPAVTRLCTALLHRDPNQRPGYTDVARTLPSPDPAPPPPGVGFESPLFVGRTAELTALREALEATHEGRPGVLLLHGPPGVGKTALVTQFLDELTEGDLAVVLRGRCHEHESVPYKAADSLVDALSSYLRRMPTEQTLHLLPRHAHALARVFPVLQRPEIIGRLRQRLPLPPDPAELWSRGQMALKELLGRLAKQTQVVLHLDDAQWSDVDGARLLASVLGPVDAPPLLLICTYRGEEPTAHPGLHTLLEGLRHQEGVDVRELALSGLSEKESKELAEGLLQPSLTRSAAQIAADSEGSPFFITLSAQWALSTLPSGRRDATESIESTLRAHIAQMDRRDQDLLEAICVAGRTVKRDLLRRVADPGDETPALRRLQSAHLLRVASGAGDALAVYHDRIRAAVLNGLAPERLTHWHARYVQALEAAAAVDATHLTYHLLGTGATQRAGASAVDAAKIAEAALAFEQAVELYDVALEHGSWDTDKQVSLLVAKAEALVNGLRAADGGATYMQAAALTTSEATRVALWTQGGEQLLLSGQTHEGLRVLGRAFEAQGLDFDALCAADCGTLMQQLLARGFAFEPTPDASLRPADLRRLQTLWAAALGLVHLRYAETFALALRCTLDALDLGSLPFIIRGLMGVSILEAAMAPGQQQVLMLMKHLCTQSGDDLEQVYLALTEANIAIFNSQPKRMLAASSRALDLLEQSVVGRVKERSIARTLVLSAHFQRGDYAALWRTSMPWLAEARQQNNTYLQTWIRIYLVIHHLAVGEPEQARKSLTRALDHDEDEPSDIVAIAVDQYSALCDAYEGNPSGWRRIAETSETLNRSELAANPLKLLDQAYFQGLVALRLAPGHPEQADLHAAAEQSAAQLESLQTPDGNTLRVDYWVGHAKLLQAGLSATRGDHSAALAFLDGAMADFDAMDSSLSSRACALRRKGQLLGAAEGAALIQEAEDELRRLGVSDLARYCDLFSPGFGEQAGVG